MDRKDSKKSTFFKKLTTPYRMVIINEETFEERTQYRITKLSLLLATLFGIVALVSLVFSTVAYTPLKEYIPGYDSSELRKQAVQNLFVTDSLITLYNQNLQYLNAVRSVLNEEISLEDPELTDQSLQVENQDAPEFISSIPEDSLLRAFVSQQDKYNPDLSSSNVALETLLLPPALGPISQEFNPEEGHYAVDIVLEKKGFRIRGDGRTGTGKSVEIKYFKSGTYTLTPEMIIALRENNKTLKFDIKILQILEENSCKDYGGLFHLTRPMHTSTICPLGQKMHFLRHLST